MLVLYFAGHFIPIGIAERCELDNFWFCGRHGRFDCHCRLSHPRSMCKFACLMFPLSHALLFAMWLLVYHAKCYKSYK